MAEEGDIDDIEMAEPEEEDDGWEYYDDTMMYFLIFGNILSPMIWTLETL